MKTTKLLITLFFFYVTLSAQAATPGSCEHIKKITKPGDILFISLPGHLFYEQVEKAMNHWASHVGFVLEENGELIVTESTYPFSKDTKFCDFVDRAKGKIAVSRLKNRKLNDRDLEELRYSSKERLGVYYHLGFKLRSSKQFCSKFVWEVFQEALGVEIGKVETFQELLDSHPDQASRDQAVQFFNVWFFRWAIPFVSNIPWDRETVTPKSQYEDRDLKTVWTWEK
ncbi:MAG: hypothetical protein EP326_14355 [Deltaproteobacteria bacterium]|jgi:GTP-binding protein EngB required for normal cell division|nr:MAG: hypothetical protein EP326_14355 [Deltaproteobacteria bacterium]TNF30148.1 MAG: hypothetical protein EP319_06045 [Deltaproteobacteria bacterium]